VMNVCENRYKNKLKPIGVGTFLFRRFHKRMLIFLLDILEGFLVGGIQAQCIPRYIPEPVQKPDSPNSDI
jgi:hypothetical protein